MNEETNHGTPLTELDYMIADPQIQMMKAAVPYMPPAQQRFLSVLIRVQELNRTMSLFRGGDLAAMGISQNDSQKYSPFEMLQAMKPYAGAREREMIEMLENLQIMFQAMQTPP